MLNLLLREEEESGSDNLEQFITDHKNKLKSDIIIISDTEFTVWINQPQQLDYEV